MRFTIQLVADAGDATSQTHEIISIDRLDGVLSIDDLGLTLGEAKAMLAALQVAITETQVLDLARRERPCPCCRQLRRLKDKRRITVRTCPWQARAAEPTIWTLPMPSCARRHSACRGRSTPTRYGCVATF